MAVGAAAVLIACLLAATGALRSLELTTLDARFAIRGAQPSETRKVAIVAIDDQTLQSIGTYPVPRHYYALALTRLRSDGARLVAVDIQFTAPTTVSQDDALINGLRRTPGTILVTAESGMTGANDVLGGAATQRYAHVRIASALLPLSPAATYRSFNLRQQGLPTLPAMVADDIEGAGAAARLGTPPISIDYAGGPGTFPTYPLSGLIAGHVPASAFRGRVRPDRLHGAFRWRSTLRTPRSPAVRWPASRSRPTRWRRPLPVRRCEVPPDGSRWS